MTSFKLSSILLSDALPKELIPLVTVSPNHSIEQVFDLLYKNKIRSVPVVRLTDENKSSDENNHSIGAKIEMIDFAEEDEEVREITRYQVLLNQLHVKINGEEPVDGE